MQNLRIINVQIIDSSNISIAFTAPLTPNLLTSNVSIISDTENVPDSKVLTIKITGTTLTLTCQPLTPFATYFLQFQSLPNHTFQSLNGDAVMPMDGVTNKFLIIAPVAPDNPVMNYLQAYLKDNIYHTNDDTTLIAQYLKSLSVNLTRALYDIKQLKTDNYLSLDIVDERKIRGAGPFDRLDQEGAFEISRLGLAPTNSTANNSFVFDFFPEFPITLQKQTAIETLLPNSLDIEGFINVNSLVLNLHNTPITKITSVVFTQNTVNQVFTYDIQDLGYQIHNSRYDQDFGFTYFPLAENQIKLNDKILNDPAFSLKDVINVLVSYEYKNLGIVIDPATVNVSTVLDAIRETLPPITNIFNLEHAPIVDGSGNIPLLGGITFTDPNSAIPNATHPAFVNEITFRLSALPASPGTYAVDYTNGKIYVFGNNLNNDGTGPFPPLATYQYLLTYQSELDYSYDADLSDMVALAHGNLIDNAGTVHFKYEQVLIPDVDYKAQLHIEALDERINNNLVALNVIKSQHSPITNVFRIFNETSGEIYTLNRWNDNKIYFRYNTPPRVNNQLSERVSFELIINELLFVHTTLTNSSTIKIFKIFLNNNNLISTTDDTLAASFNSSLNFSNGNVFIAEKWFDREFNEEININRLINVGQYMVDYPNGVIYIAVSNTQTQNIGTATYKKDNIIPQFPHLITVDDIYYRITPLDPKNERFSFTSFGENSIVPEIVKPADEFLLNNSDIAPYQIFNTNVGAFVNSAFVNGITNQIKFVRSLYEYQDLLNSTHPLNFANVSIANGFNVSINSLSGTSFEGIQYDGTTYFVLLNQNIPFLSPNITFTFSIIRTADQQQLWDASGIIVAGNPVKLILPVINNPQVGDLVKVSYTFTINDLSRVVIDYNKGDLFVDYSYLADEIVISYEYGDNVIDFRGGQKLSAGDQYFATYKIGALRDALIKNFSTLVNIPLLSDIKIDFNRERYREALMAALGSFIQGPTIAAIKNIGKTISHIEPEITESAFQSWNLGSSLLNPEPIKTTGKFQLLPAKFSNGVLINEPNQTITFPTSSNIRLEEGTFETWISPQWNGLDNDANLTFNILVDGYNIDPSRVFIGASEYHPTIINGLFSLNKNTEVKGKPNTNKDGIFIYYNKDLSGNFDRWYVQVIDGYDGYMDGYADGYNSTYKFKINTDGVIYDNKSITSPKPSNLSIFTGTTSINFTLISSNHTFNQGLTFLADPDHYLWDTGNNTLKNRLSIYKDASGYLNFRAINNEKMIYTVSADVSSWKINDLHHVAASWKLNTRNNRDEMHLFLDGFEVPNIIKYGQKLQPYLHEKFRTIDPEEIVGLSNRDIVGSDDLATTLNSATVSSSINFSAFNILVGDTIFIDELGFNSNGYSIISINGQTLVLNTTMPATLTDARFSINRTNFTVNSEIDLYPNIMVSTIHASLIGNDLSGSSGSNQVNSASINFSTQGIMAGSSIRINAITLPLTFIILQVSGNSLILDSNLPSNVSNSNFQIYPTNQEHELHGVRSLHPDYSISKDSNFNDILTISNSVLSNDLIMIRTLGLNFRAIKKQYFVWSDKQENILMTRLPPPISLDEANITKIILPSTAISSANSTFTAGIFVSNNLPATDPSNEIVNQGRTLSATISGNNTDFSTPVSVTLHGTTNTSAIISETLTFTDYGTQDFTNFYIGVDYLQVNVKPMKTSNSALAIQVKEKYPMTHSELDGYVPVIQYSYHIGGGNTLQKNSANSVRDDNNLFSGFDVNNSLLIQSPPSVAGYYKIINISSDRKVLFLEATATSSLPLADFTNGTYQILNINAFRSGLQNGFFTFEIKNLPSTPYLLPNGFYELDYNTYARIKFDPLNNFTYIGSDFNGNRQINAILDQIKIYSIMLTDTRIGEVIPSNQRSITKDFNSLKALKSDPNTLALINFDTAPFTNDAQFYITPTNDRQHFQSSIVVNKNFGRSLVITDKPLILSNSGILDTRKEGTVEFWISPIFDTANDPNTRYYFDAYSAVLEEAISVNDVSVKIKGAASQILGVTLQSGDPHFDYFAGGKLELDTQRAIQEETVSLNANTVIAARPILQVLTVKIFGDLTEQDYFADGRVSADRKSIYLGRSLPRPNLPLIVTYQSTDNKNDTLNTQVIRLNRKLPTQNTPVIVKYIPKGLQGDRLSIYKDLFGYINFTIIASKTNFTVRAPTRWAKNTWHRVKASYKVNGGLGTDEMRLFLDGYEWTDVLFGSGITFAPSPFVFGAVTVGDGYHSDGYQLATNIRFKDPINELFIGSDYTTSNPIFSLIDNFRISNISRPIYAPYGEPLDVNFSTNLDVAFPVTHDLFTTYLSNFDTTKMLNTDFATLKNKKTGLFDFSVNIIDAFDIVSSDIKVKEILETLIKILKPANSRAFISYSR